MDCVLPGLYVGNYRDSKDQQQLDKFQISHIVAIHDSPRRLLPDKHYLCVMASDTPDQNLSQYFAVCNDFIHAARLREGSVLIHCLAGMSRSVTVAVAYIMTATNLSWKEALKVVRAGRAVANPNVGFQTQLQEFEMYRLGEERRRLRERFPSTALEELDRTKCAVALDNYQELLQNKDICEGNCSRGEKCPTGGLPTKPPDTGVRVGAAAVGGAAVGVAGAVGVGVGESAAADVCVCTNADVGAGGGSGVGVGVGVCEDAAASAGEGVGVGVGVGVGEEICCPCCREKRVSRGGLSYTLSFAVQQWKKRKPPNLTSSIKSLAHNMPSWMAEVGEVLMPNVIYFPPAAEPDSGDELELEDAEIVEMELTECVDEHYMDEAYGGLDDEDYDGFDEYYGDMNSDDEADTDTDTDAAADAGAGACAGAEYS